MTSAKAPPAPQTPLAQGTTGECGEAFPRQAPVRARLPKACLASACAPSACASAPARACTRAPCPCPSPLGRRQTGHAPLARHVPPRHEGTRARARARTHRVDAALVGAVVVELVRLHGRVRRVHRVEDRQQLPHPRPLPRLAPAIPAPPRPAPPPVAPRTRTALPRTPCMSGAGAGTGGCTPVGGCGDTPCRTHRARMERRGVDGLGGGLGGRWGGWQSSGCTGRRAEAAPGRRRRRPARPPPSPPAPAPPPLSSQHSHAAAAGIWRKRKTAVAAKPASAGDVRRS